MAVNKIIKELQKGAVQIANLLQKRDVEYTKDSNASGDNQLKVDVLADKLFADILSEINIKGYASEEQERATFLKKDKNDMFRSGEADYNINDLLVAYDPLDGSSLIDSNLSIGSIFGIYLNDFSGKNLIASAYFLYGPRLEMVAGVTHKALHYIYSYTTHSWEYIGEIKMEQKGKINAPGGTQKYWSKKHKALIESFFSDGYRLRYSGGMVADLHQILCKGGGIFSYPATSDSKKGKLRALFEVFPFALIFEYAGGGAIVGEIESSEFIESGSKDSAIQRLLEIQIDSIHASTPCYFGSMAEIQKVLHSFKK